MREYIELKLGNPALTRVLIVTSDPVNIESQNQAKNIPIPNQILGKSVQGILGYDRTNKQRLPLYIYRLSFHYRSNFTFSLVKKKYIVSTMEIANISA